MKILLSALVLLTFLGCTKTPFQEKIGIAFSSRPDLLHGAKLREQWNLILAQQGFTSQFLSVQIKKSQDGNSGRTFYFLYGETSDNAIKMAQLLFKKQKYFYIDAQHPDYIICADCPEAVPRRYDYQWTCENAIIEQECNSLNIAMARR